MVPRTIILGGGGERAHEPLLRHFRLEPQPARGSHGEYSWNYGFGYLNSLENTLTDRCPLNGVFEYSPREHPSELGFFLEWDPVGGNGYSVRLDWLLELDYDSIKIVRFVAEHDYGWFDEWNPEEDDVPVNPHDSDDVMFVYCGDFGVSKPANTCAIKWGKLLKYMRDNMRVTSLVVGGMETCHSLDFFAQFLSNNALTRIDLVSVRAMGVSVETFQDSLSCLINNSPNLSHLRLADTCIPIDLSDLLVRALIGATNLTDLLLCWTHRERGDGADEPNEIGKIAWLLRDCAIRIIKIKRNSGWGGTHIQTMMREVAQNGSIEQFFYSDLESRRMMPLRPTTLTAAYSMTASALDGGDGRLGRLNDMHRANNTLGFVSAASGPPLYLDMLLLINQACASYRKVGGVSLDTRVVKILLSPVFEETVRSLMLDAGKHSDYAMILAEVLIWLCTKCPRENVMEVIVGNGLNKLNRFDPVRRENERRIESYHTETPILEDWGGVGEMGLYDGSPLARVFLNENWRATSWVYEVVKSNPLLWVDSQRQVGTRNGDQDINPTHAANGADTAPSPITVGAEDHLPLFNAIRGKVANPKCRYEKRFYEHVKKYMAMKSMQNNGSLLRSDFDKVNKFIVAFRTTMGYLDNTKNDYYDICYYQGILQGVIKESQKELVINK